MPRQRTCDHDEILRLREEQGWTYAKIGALFGIAPGAARNIHLTRMREPGSPFSESRETAFRRLAEANVRHLIDFKRAGHRYGHGELRLPNDECAVRPPRPLQPGSIIGSSSSMCVDAA